LPELSTFYLGIWLSEVKRNHTRLNIKIQARFFFEWTFLPAELERGTKALQFDVCCEAVTLFKISTVVAGICRVTQICTY